MITDAQIEAVRSADLSVAEKIRRLDAAGLPRAEIARRLGKLYQHVRNVLEADRLRSQSPPSRPKRSAMRTAEQPDRSPSFPAHGPGVEEATAEFKGVYRLVVGPDGSIRLPDDLLANEGWRPGQVLTASMKDDTLVIETARAVRMRAQAYVCQVVGPGRSLVAELIEDRRREAEAEGG